MHDSLLVLLPSTPLAEFAGKSMQMYFEAIIDVPQALKFIQ